MEERPPEKRLRVVPFTVHATRGLIRDERIRRWTMAILLLVALGMMAIGLSGLQPWLEPREHPARFLLFWAICGWFTLTALLLALLDLLMLRARNRQARRAMREELEKPDGSGQ